MARALVLALLPLAAAYRNVNGGELASCSSSGMALTGYTRSGECIDQNDDAGSHHVCIDMSTNTGGNFCSVTGQSDWCSSSMACHGDSASRCDVEHWCVCQWAFASYITNAGGATRFRTRVRGDEHGRVDEVPRAGRAVAEHATALECLESRRGLSEEANAARSSSRS